MPWQLQWMDRILGRSHRQSHVAHEGAMIMGVDYQRRSSNFDFGGKRYAIDRTEVTINGVALAYGRIRQLRINRSYVSGLLGRFSLPGLILMALGLMPAKRMQSVLRAEIVDDAGVVHAVSSMSARGFGKLPSNQLEEFRWFIACLVNRLPPDCQQRVGSLGGFAAGISLFVLALLLFGCAGWLLVEHRQWLTGGLLAATALACGWVGFMMLRNGVSRRVDGSSMLTYLSSK
jgi:hypothetical protein